MNLNNEFDVQLEANDGAKTRILVVDDRAINRECLTALLGHKGYAVAEAAGGSEALQSARAWRPHLIVTDILMPGMDGFELFNELKADAVLSAIPVIFYTAAFRHEELAFLATRHANTKVLAKPSEPRVILSAVAEALGRGEPPRGQEGSRPLADSQAINLRLSTLLELSLALAGEREPGKLLRLACRGARDILDVPHVAVGLVDEAGCLEHLEAIGLAVDVHGTLGTRQPDTGFLAAFHPAVDTIQVQEICSAGRCYGWLYLAGRRRGSILAAESEQIAVNLAAQLALAWENLRYQQLMEERGRRLAGMIESAMDAIITVDEKQRIQIFNSAAETMFGYRREDMVGQAFHRLLPERFGVAGEGREKSFWRLMTPLEKGPVVGFSGLRADGTEFPVEASISTVQEGSSLFSTIILRDITDRLATERALRRAREDLEVRVKERTQALQEANRALQTEVQEHLLTEAELRRSNGELEQMAYIITHDLQEPLRTVNNFVQLLARRYQGKLGEEADQFIAFAVDGVSRMRDLILDVLEYARINGGRVIQTELADSRAALDTALANLQGAIQEAGAQIRVDALPPVAVDRQQLCQLFQNLLSNALKFRSEAPPCIQVSAVPEGGEWRFCVRDNGIGIAPAYHQRIFDIFKRLHARTEYPGTGVGLALCKKIVERHGGRMWVESAPGDGACFWFTLPGEAARAAA